MVDYKNLSRDELIHQLEAIESQLHDTGSESNAMQLAHDLQVHQIELEMQNRELRDKQLELEVARDKYADLYDFAPVGYLTLDKKGLIREINLTAVGLLEQTRTQLLNKPFIAFLANGQIRDFQFTLLQALEMDEERGVDLQLKHTGKTVSDIHMQMLASNETSGEPMVRAVIINISEKKLAERTLLKEKEKAEEANRVKSEFLTRMSHELRTPLNAILGFAQILQHRDAQGGNSKNSNDIEQILRSGWHLLDLVNDLLDLSRIEADKVDLEIENVKLHERIQDSIAIVRPLALERDISIEYPSTDKPCAGILVLADRFRLKQVLLNLLSNAIKYNRQGGDILIECQPAANERVRIVVKDTGSGIAAEDFPALFEPFSRLYLETYAQEGTGIGLAISKQLVELMGGSIGVESERGKGSSFWIELALSPAEAKILGPGLSASATQASDKNTYDVLYIEDNPSHLQLMDAIFAEQPDLHLRTAHTPSLGLELALQHSPDLIICDICLPGMDGFQVLTKLQQSEALHSIPVIALSANASPAVIERGLRAGFRRYLTKPVNLEELIQAMEELLGDS